MSRLDSFIRRLEAQRACLDRAAALIAALAGPVLEFGLGNGRTYDHLRTILPGRDIFVFERAVADHPDCVPPSDRLILGDLRDTLPASRDRFPGSAALAHLDIATGETEASLALAASLAQLIAPLLRQGAIVGEIAILCDVPRTATIKARERLVCLRISKELFLRLLNEFPQIAIAVVRELAHRIEMDNVKLQAALAEVAKLRASAPA